MSCGCVMCLSAMVIVSALCVVVRWSLNALTIFQMWAMEVKRLIKSVDEVGPRISFCFFDNFLAFCFCSFI